MSLTAAFVKGVRHGGGCKRANRHHDQHGLYLQVMPFMESPHPHDRRRLGRDAALLLDSPTRSSACRRPRHSTTSDGGSVSATGSG